MSVEPLQKFQRFLRLVYNGMLAWCEDRQLTVFANRIDGIANGLGAGCLLHRILLCLSAKMTESHVLFNHNYGVSISYDTSVDSLGQALQRFLWWCRGKGLDNALQLAHTLL